jgi:cytoskeleton protein RodZ
VGEFGDKFRKAREKKGISFDDASNVTKIGSRMLKAIEEEDFDRLPGGVFNKGFIRAYAKHLGLNEEDAIAAYLACVQKAQAEAYQALEPPSAESRPDARRKQRFATPAAKPQTSAPVEELPHLQLPRADHVRPRQKSFSGDSPDIPWRIIAVAALVIILAVILWMRRSHNSRAASAAASPAAATQPTPPPATTSAPANLPPQTAPGDATPSHPPAQTSAPAPVATATHPTTATPATAAPASNEHNDNNDKNDVTVHTSQRPNPKLSESDAPSLTLVVRALETSWISLTADGQPVGHETLIAPARTSVRAHREITVKVGNAAGVAFLWNGQEIPADGAESEVKTYTFDSTGMHVAPSAPPPAPNQ